MTQENFFDQPSYNQTILDQPRHEEPVKTDSEPSTPIQASAQTDDSPEIDPRLEHTTKAFEQICQPEIARRNALNLLGDIDARNTPGLVNRLHNDNKTTRAIFEQITGLTLPKHHLTGFIESWTGNPMPVTTRPNKPVAPVISTGNPQLDQFLATLTPLRAGKVKQHLGKRYREAGLVRPLSEWIEDYATRGLGAQIKHDRYGDLEYYAWKADRGYKISLTAMRYLEFITKTTAATPPAPGLVLAKPSETQGRGEERLRKFSDKTIGEHQYFYDGWNWVLVSNTKPGHKRVAFELGHIGITPGVSELDGDQLKACFARHANNDWGDVSDTDARANDDALKDGARLMSKFDIDGTTIWIITEANRSNTVALLPEEY